MANTGQEENSNISGLDLLSEALGESGLNLEEPIDYFDNAAPNTLSSYDGFDYLSLLDDLNSLTNTTTETPLVNEHVVENVPLGLNLVENNDLFSKVEPISTAQGLRVERSRASEPSNVEVPVVPAQSTRLLQQILSQNALNTSTQRQNFASPSPRMIDLASTSSPVHSNQIQWGNYSSMLSKMNQNEQGKKELTKKDVLRLWSNEDITMNTKPEDQVDSADSVDAEDEDEDEDLGYTDTYADYMPSKLSFGRRHPDPVVETSSLASVSPPNIWYKLKLPKEVIEQGLLSALQLEAVVYSCQEHETFLSNGSRAGFLIGDGAGVGKGRIVAGIIYENYLLGRKRAIWLSVSNDLKHDAYRDLKDIGCHIHVNSLNKFKYDVKLSAKSMGGIKKGVIFATYSSLIGESQSGGKYNTRLKQLLHWCGSDFDGVIILDECHKAKNLVPTGSSKPTKTGLTVLSLQNSLPKARVVYCSATGASEPKNMAYMSRLGIWGTGTPFREFNEFIQAVERRGVGAMEIVAMDMKLRGRYMARQLSFAGVGFDIRDVCLSEDFIAVYDAAVKLWVEAREKFEKASDLMDAGGKLKKTMWGQFWSAHQRFFKYMCIASKVKAVVEIARKALDVGKCIVIGLQSTGEARTLEQLEEAGGELTDFVSTAKGVIQTLVDKHFPATDRKKMADLSGFRDTYLNGSRSEVPSPVPQKKRKLNSMKESKPSKKSKTGLERIFDLSSGSESDSSDNVMNDSKDNEDSQDSIESDVNDQSSADNSGSGEEDDFNPFGGLGSDQEDPWLNHKVKKKTKSKSRGESPSIGDPSINNALAAAGLSVSTPIWNRPVNGVPNLASVRTSSPTPYSRNTGSPIARTQQNMHHSQSAPVLSSLLQKAEGSPTLGSASDQCCAMKRELLEKIEELGKILPPNTLDELINSLGGPDNVAEMTGRKGRVVCHDDGSVSYESRSRQDVSLELLNIEEKKRFMNGDKHIAIISEAASSGISLQADRRVKNQRRRVHITLELPWSADKAIQQFGRSHRSNQVSAPEYIFLISELAGERRFASIVAKRLESLGALTHGDRRATESRDLSRYNFDNKYGRAALETVLKSVLGLVPPLVPPPAEYKGNFFNDVRVALLGVGLVTKDERGSYNMLDKDYTNLSRFLNRILGVTVALQNSLFMYFTDTLGAVIQQAKRNGRWDEGIVDLGSHGEEVTELSVQTFVGSKTIGTATTELHTVSVERGLSWDKAYNMSVNQTDPNEGFYLSHQVRNEKRIAIFVVSQNSKKKVYGCYRPNTGLQSKHETIQDIKKKYKKVTSSEAKQYWISQYESSFSQCSHAYWKGNCKRATLGLSCEVGLRRRSYNILSGSVLSVWSKVENVLAGQSGSNSKVQIIRCKRSDGGKIVGCLIPGNCVPALARTLSHEEGQTEAIEIL